MRKIDYKKELKEFYKAPHKEAVFILNELAMDAEGVPYMQLSEEKQASLKITL